MIYTAAENIYCGQYVLVEKARVYRCPHDQHPSGIAFDNFLRGANVLRSGQLFTKPAPLKLIHVTLNAHARSGEHST